MALSSKKYLFQFWKFWYTPLAPALTELWLWQRLKDKGPSAAARQAKGPTAAARQARGPSAAARVIILYKDW